MITYLSSLENTFFQQIICIPNENKLCPSPCQSFPFQKLIKDKRFTEAKAFNLTFSYIDNILPINNPNYANWIPLIYPQKIEIKYAHLLHGHTDNKTTNQLIRYLVSLQ